MHISYTNSSNNIFEQNNTEHSAYYGSVFGPPIFFQHKCGKSYKSTIIFYEQSRTIPVYSEITWSFYLKNKQTFTSLSYD